MARNKLLKRVAVSVSMAFLITPFLNVKSHAANTYYIRSVLDEGSFGIVTQIVADSGESPAELGDGVNYQAIQDYRNVYKEGKLIADFTKITELAKSKDSKKDEVADNPNLNTADKDMIKQGLSLEETVQTVYADFLGEGDKNKGLVFSFPGIIKTNYISYYTAKSSDAQRAELVGNTLTKGINDALLFIKTYSGVDNISEDGLRHILSKLCQTSQFPHTKKSFGFNTGKDAGRKGFSVNLVEGPNQKMDGSPGVVKTELVPVNDMDYSDYLRISTTDKNGKIVYGYFPWKMDKGYYSSQSLASIVGKDYVEKAEKEGMENKYLTWGQLIIQAAMNADNSGMTSSNVVDDSMTLIGQGLGSDLTATIGSVRSILNLAPIQELILNMGSRSVTHHYGVMTQAMYSTAQEIYVLTMLVSLLALSSLVIKMIHQKMSSTINVGAKLSLMEGFKDLCFVSVMLMFFPALFELMLELNYYIVKTFSFSSEFLQAYQVSNAKVMGMQSLAGFVISSMFLSIDTYINVVYLIRAITCSFLFAISPVVTISYAWGSSQKKLYMSYLREIVGNIFMQSFHAVTMCFFASYNTSNLSSLEAIAATYSFIPITQLFRSLVIGSNGGFSEQIGGKLAGQLTNTAFGMQKSGVAMKQAKQMAETNSKNQAKMASATLKTNSLGIAADAGANLLMNNNIDSELARRSMSGASPNIGAAKKANLKNAGIGAGAALLSAGAGAMFQGKAAADNSKKLGELQMKHSMENMGMGLAQAGVGMGVQSYDNAGGGIASSGVMSMERAAESYGEGSGVSNTAGLIGYATGAERFGLMADKSLRGVNKDYIKEARSINKQEGKMLGEQDKFKSDEDARLEREAKAKKEYEDKVERLGLDTGLQEGGSYNETSNVFMRGKDGNRFGNGSGEVSSPLTDIHLHDGDNTNNVTLGFDTSKFDNVSDNDTIKRLYSMMKSGTSPDSREYKELRRELENEYGLLRNSTPRVDGGKLYIDISNTGKAGFVVGEENQVFAISKHVKENGYKPKG